MITDIRPESAPVETVRPLDEAAFRAKIDAILNRRPAVGLAIGVVHGARLELFNGHGLADVASRTPITEDTVFRVASITKTFTAIAIMQLWEDGLVDLDAPANDYLRAYKLVPTKAGFRPATVRHLLTHTAGVPETLHPLDMLRPDWGESVPLGSPVPSLAELYRGGLRVEAEPGSRFVYGNHSPATLGQIVEDVTGETLDRRFRERIFEPLGMHDTDVLRSDRVPSRLATGYKIGPGGPRAVSPRVFSTAGAAAVCSSSADMARYVAALLGRGANEHGRILRPATLAMMFEAQHRPDPRLTGMGLGFFREDVGGPLAVGHKGLLPAFDSQITLAPDDGVGVIGFTNGAPGATMWISAEVAGLVRWLLGLPDDGVRGDIPQHPEVWPEVCGWYRLDAGLGDVRLRTVLGLGIEVFVRGGELAVRMLVPIPSMYRGFALHPDDPADPYAFRMDMSEFGMGTSRVVFEHDETAGTTAVHLDLMPLTLTRQPAATNPRRWATGALGALGVLGVAAATAAVRGRPAGRPSSVP